MVGPVKGLEEGAVMTHDAGFVARLMAHILEGVDIPKVQIERVVGPILGFFIDRVLTATLADDPELAGDYVMLCPEFPLKKAGNNQSTNIDWLLFNRTRQALVLLELKTTDTTFSVEQAEGYLEKKALINREGGAALLDDLLLIADASAESGKYKRVHELIAERCPDGLQGFAACRRAHVMYLVPEIVKSARKSRWEGVDRVLSFGDLAQEIPAPFVEEWHVIHAALKVLDTRTRRQRNGQQDVSTSMASRGARLG